MFTIIIINGQSDKMASVAPGLGLGAPSIASNRLQYFRMEGRLSFAKRKMTFPSPDEITELKQIIFSQKKKRNIYPFQNENSINMYNAF